MLTKTMLSPTTPEAQGIASEAILAFVNGVEEAKIELHSFILVRHGHAVAKGWWAPYATELPHVLFSLSKSFTSTAVGLAVAEGLLTVQDRVVDFFPDDLPEHLDENLAVMTVYNLLTMATGHEQDVTGPMVNQPEGNWVKGFLALPVEHTPGSKFVYNSAATYMLSAIVQKLTGKTLIEYLTPRLFEPLNIVGATWDSCPRGISVGGWGLKIKTDEIARFGQLYLQQGEWQGKQLITSDWVAQATAKQVPNDSGDPNQNIDWAQGYGYQFWRCQHGAYRGDGAFGQYCIVMPAQDAVLAITSGLGNMQTVLDLAWKYLLPAMQDAPLAENSSANAALSERLASLQLVTQRGAQTSALAQQVSGKRYTFAENKQGIASVQFDFNEQGARVTLEDERGTHTVPVGYQQWAAGSALLDRPFYENVSHSTAASGAWIQEDTYQLRLALNETPFIPLLTCRFVGDHVEFSKGYNVGFGSPEDLKGEVLVSNPAS